MNVFVTGASGFIGSAVLDELLNNGHTVTALARSDDAETALRAKGAEVVRGSLSDLDTIADAAKNADGVIHLAFIHDFNDFAASSKADTDAISAIGDTLSGSDKPFAVAAGIAGLAPGRVLTEDDAAPNGPRMSEQVALAYADKGVRAVAVRLAPSVHGDTDHHGFIPSLIKVARDKNLSVYPTDGENRWPAVHVRDAARLFRIALESAPAGTRVHAVGDEGVRTRDIAEAIGKGTGTEVGSIAEDDIDTHFDWIGRFFSLDIPASNTLTRERFGWEPENPGLLDDLAAEFYFKQPED